MRNNSIKIISYLSVLIVLIINACDKKSVETNNSSPEYIKMIMDYRAEQDSMMKFAPYSPFKHDTSVVFTGLKYFPPDESFVFKSKLHPVTPPDTVQISGTKGELRRVTLEGYLMFNKDGKEYRVNVYKSFSQTGEPYYSIWFTDRTTGKETYGVGRYLEIEYNQDPDFVYTIDFNKAYNPYCAYTPVYTCPIPRKEDYLDLIINAGEMNYH